MRKTFVAIATIAVLFGMPAFAADFPIKAPSLEAAPSSIYSWTGFYIGGNIGGVWARSPSASDFFDPNAQGASLVDNPQANSTQQGAVIGGVHGGYNWQAARGVVLGAEADFDWTRVRPSFCRQTDTLGLPCLDNSFGFLTLSQSTDWIATARIRVGYAWDRFMIYGTGGGALGHVNSSINANCLVDGCGSSAIKQNINQSFSGDRGGWVAGAGAEVMLTPAWIARVEYLHTDLGNVSSTLNLPAANGILKANQIVTWSRGLTYDTVRAGVSYKFGGP